MQKKPVIKKKDETSYNPDTDIICMPAKNQFTSIEEYYVTLFHELIHSTLHEKRLNRKIKNIEKKEELVAEILNIRLDLAWLGLMEDVLAFADAVVASEEDGFDVSDYTGDVISQHRITSSQKSRQQGTLAASVRPNNSCGARLKY